MTEFHAFPSPIIDPQFYIINNPGSYFFTLDQFEGPVLQLESTPTQSHFIEITREVLEISKSHVHLISISNRKFNSNLETKLP